MSLSARTGLSLNMGARRLDDSSPGVPVSPRLRCKRCGGKWTGSHLLFCDACEERELDLMADAQDEQDMRESDRGLVW